MQMDKESFVRRFFSEEYLPNKVNENANVNNHSLGFANML